MYRGIFPFYDVDDNACLRIDHNPTATKVYGGVTYQWGTRDGLLGVGNTPPTGNVLGIWVPSRRTEPFDTWYKVWAEHMKALTDVLAWEGLSDILDEFLGNTPRDLAKKLVEHKVSHDRLTRNLYDNAEEAKRLKEDLFKMNKELLQVNELVGSLGWYWDREDRETSHSSPWDIVQDNDMVYGIDRGGVVETKYYARIDEDEHNPVFTVITNTAEEAERLLGEERLRRVTARLSSVNARLSSVNAVLKEAQDAAKIRGPAYLRVNADGSLEHFEYTGE